MKQKSQLLELPTYNPNDFFDSLCKKLRVISDSELAKKLNISRVVISKIRHRTIPIGSSLLMRAHEITDIPVRKLRNTMGDYRISFFEH